MSGAARLIERIDDAMNPIVVRELRQAVRGKFVSMLLLGFLLLQLITMGLFIMNSSLGDSTAASTNEGRPAFLTLYAILLITSVVCIPGYAGVRLASERSDANVDLLYITTITPRSIVFGKILSAMVLALLVASSSLPFMVFTYFMRGIDLPSIFVLLGAYALAVLAAIVIAITLATMPISRPFRVVVAAGLGLACFPAITLLIVFASEFLQSGGGSAIMTGKFWVGALIVLGFVAGGCAALGSIAISQLTSPAANRALPVRIAFTALTLLTFAGAMLTSIGSSDSDPVVVWTIMQFIMITLAVFVSSSERRELGSRVLRSIPANPVGRRVAYFFFSGAPNGMIWSVGLTVATFAMLLAGIRGLGRHAGIPVDDAEKAGLFFANYSLYLFAYAFAAIALQERRPLSKVPAAFTWTILLGLAIGGSVLPILGWAAFGGPEPYSNNFSAWMFATPFGSADEVRPERLIFAGILLGGALLTRLGWFISSWRTFRRPASS